MLSYLSKEDRQVFIELFYNGKTVKEVAEERNISQDAIYQRISRGRKRMKKKGLSE